MAEPFPHAESKKLQGSSKVDKKEIIQADSSPQAPHPQLPFQQWKDYSTSQDLKHESRPESKLDLSGRGLRTLREMDLSNLHQVVEVNLSYNPLYSSALKYLHLPSLKKLNLSSCGLTELPRLYNCNQLEELSLCNNPLDSKSKTCSCPTLCIAPYLKKLNLVGCGLTELPCDLNCCCQLEELNLSNNPLDSKSSSCWYPMLCIAPHLKKLGLSGCGLIELPYALQSCWNLQKLNLSNNFIGHSDLLERLKRENKPNVPGWHRIDVKPVSVLSIMQLPKLMKVVFEDGVYTQSKGAWAVEKREDVSSTSNSESAEQSVASFKRKMSLFHEIRAKKIVDPSTCEETMLSDEENDSDEEICSSCEVCEMRKFYPEEENDSDETIYCEFSRMKKMNRKLTIENYHSILFSLKIAVCVLESNNAGYIFTRKLSCGRCLKTVNDELLKIEPKLYCLSIRMFFLVQESITHLKNGVILLFKSLLGQSFSEESDQRLRRAFEMAFEKASEAFFSESSTNDKILVSKLRMISKILASSSKPEAEAFGCLQLLQELHDLREIREMFLLPEYGSETLTIRKINVILFKFVRVFLKPPPTAEEWPATIQLDGKIHNPLTDDDRFFESRMLDVSFPQELEILQSIISRQGSQDRCENGTKVPVISNYGQTVVKSITVGQQGGCFSVPAVSAFLVFPPDGVQQEVTLRCSRVNRKECEVKLRDGEAFVSRILKIEPEDMVFQKPVAVLLSHSVYEDQDFLDFYELVTINVNSDERQELKTERISCVKDLPKETSNSEIVRDDLPFVKATIYETCTLVATARFKSDQVLVPTNRTRVFFKKYGESKEVKITFPAGVTEKILCLTVQLFPADAVFNSDVYLDDNLVCAPVIKVSGQTERFLKPVDVELFYADNDVANIEEDFLPVGKKIRFTTEYGLLLRSHKETESRSKRLQTFNESKKVYIKRLRKDQLKFSFSLKHFCNLCAATKKCASAQLPRVEQTCIINQTLSANHKYRAFVWAVHDCERNLLYAPKVAMCGLESS